MSFRFIEELDEARAAARALAGEPRLAVDSEAAGFHRYTDRLSLVQVSTRDETFLFDPLGLDLGPVLGPLLENGEREIVMHGADYDLRLFDRDLGARVARLFDTQIAAALVGEPNLGLSSLLEAHFGVRLSKKHQKADWARRPLPDEMLEYAADDTRYLLDLADLLAERLRELGRLGWAREEFELLTRVRWEEPTPEDPVVRVKGARDLDPRALARLRAALSWRDRTARDEDRAPFRVAGDPALVAIAARPPGSVKDLREVRGFPSGRARSSGETLLRALREVEAIPEDQVPAVPRPRGRGRGRPPPEVEARLNAIREVRNRCAEELGIDRGLLLPNATLLEIAWDDPGSRDELLAVEGVKRWQVEAAGDPLLDALRRG